MTRHDKYDELRVLRPDVVPLPPAPRGTHKQILRRAARRRARSTALLAGSAIAVAAVVIAVPLALVSNNNGGVDRPPVAAAAPSRTATPTTSPEPGDVPALTTVPVEALVLAPAPTKEKSAWTGLPGCAPGTPEKAADIRSGDSTTADGTRQTQQVVAYPEVGAAIAEANRVAARLRQCADSRDFNEEGVPVGIQGVLLQLGRVGLLLTRRGNALTMLTVEGPEDPAAALDDLGRTAFDALCVFDRSNPCR